MAIDLDNDNESLWNEFLAAWPIERLRSMRLDEYASSGDKECFIYWLEFRLGGYGSIAGGSAFKFGIYSRKSETNEAGGDSLAYDANYGWYRKFGSTPEAAFEVVRSHVLSVAQSAQDGRLEAIDDIPLGPTVKWKIAFHYQSRSAPIIACVFLREPLLYFLDLPLKDKTRRQSELYRTLADRRGEGESILAFSKRVWHRWGRNRPYVVKLKSADINAGQLNFTLLSAPFPESMRGGGSDSELGDLALFVLDSGDEFRSDLIARADGTGRLRQSLAAYFSKIGAQPGDRVIVTPISDGSFKISHESASTVSRSASPEAELDGEDPMPVSTSSRRPPLNQILFGPPGTGKTFQTINKALEVLAPELLLASPDDRTALKAAFDQFVQAGRIRFVTFHQSFSYEDFVEGLRADKDDQGNLRYHVESGVFKDICTMARGSAHVASSIGVNEATRIWKISIDGTHASVTRDYCFANDEARIGWGEVGNLRRPDLLQSADYQEWGSHDRNTMQAFANEVQIGDVMLCIKSASEIQAVGVVNGDYRFDPVVPNGLIPIFNNVRPVKWLKTGLAVDLRKLNGNRIFTQKTLYELDRFDWPELAEALAAAGVNLDAPSHARSQAPLDHVLIIDEINRGNISRIFGELITLIEPSKRAGELEQLEVVLPYSKKPFAVPSNVYLIGTMNTADRSLTGLDIALRRRFEFVEMPAMPERLEGVMVDGIDIRAMLEVMNQRIEALLGRNHHLGHAYFMPLKDDRSLPRLATIFRNQILPLLQEYFFEDWQKIAWVLNDHRKRAKEHMFVVKTQYHAEGLFGTDSDAPREAAVWHVNPDALQEARSYIEIIRVDRPERAASAVEP